MNAGRTTIALIALLGAGMLAAPAATAQDGPQTAWGTPDLQGVWDFRTITPLQRPESLGTKEFLTAEEAAELEQEAVNRNIELWEAEARPAEAGGNVGAYNNFWMDRGTNVVGDRRTSLIVDPPNGRLPQMTDGGQARAALGRGSFRPEGAHTYTDLSNADRCIIGFNAGPPITPGGYNQNVQIFQTPDHVVLLTEMVHTVRMIPLDGRPALGDDLPQWSGDSRGRWEGDTLVVDTANFAAKRNWRGSGTGMRLVERFRRVDDGTLEYEYTVTDPETWRDPWTVRLLMQANDQQVFEYACHEGNYSMEAMLGGARAEEREAATEQQQ